MKYYILRNYSTKFCGLVRVVDHDLVAKNPELKEEGDYGYKYMLGGSHPPMPSLDEWKPVRMRPYKEAGKNKTVADFHQSTFFSSRAFEVLSSFFLKNGQCYPLITEEYNEDDRTFFSYDCHTIIDCLDVEKSHVKETYIGSGEIIMVLKPFLHHDAIPDDVDLFMLPYNSDIYVSERFVNLVKNVKPALKGFEFIPEGKSLYPGLFPHLE